MHPAEDEPAAYPRPDLAAPQLTVRALATGMARRAQRSRIVKLLVIGLLAVLLLVGAFGGLTIMGIVPDVLGVRAMVAGPLGLTVETAAEEEDTGPPAHDPGPEPVFLRMPQFAVPVIMDGRAESQLMLSLRLHVDPDSRGEVTRAMPRLQDAVLTGLIDALPRIRQRTGRLDLPSIKARINAILREQMGPDPIHDALIDIAYDR